MDQEICSIDEILRDGGKYILDLFIQMTKKD